MNPFFDSSFLVKLYVSEADSPVAIALANTIHGMPSISTLTDVEMASALLRRDPKFQGPAAYAKYRSNRDRGDYRVVSVESPTYVLARQLVERHAHHARYARLMRSNWLVRCSMERASS